MTNILQAETLSRFNCLCEKCEDTCCKGWSMQLDEPTLQKYKTQAPELLEAVEPAEGLEDTAWIMRKDSGTGYCVKYEGGLCGIHKARGADFLGDACHFYPRATKQLGDKIVMTATLSCPEIARLAFEGEGDFYMPAQMERLPHGLRQYAPEGLGGDEALSIHQTFLDAVDDRSASIETIFARINSVSHSLQMIDRKSWAGAAPIFLKLADGRLPAPDTNPVDAFNLLHALCGLIVATKKPMSERLRQTVEDMEQALAAKLDWENVLIYTDEKSLPALHRLEALWKTEAGVHYDKILRRYLKMQLSLALFPFSGLAEPLADRAALIGVRFATIKLALMCGCGMHGPVLPPEMVVRIVQSLSRFLDHLGDTAFSLRIYSETGWVKEPRMRGLLSA
jgi:lysine-N-methylase